MSRYDVTIQSRSSKPPSASVMEMSEVLTMVVSRVERKSERQRLRVVSQHAGTVAHGKMNNTRKGQDIKSPAGHVQPLWAGICGAGDWGGIFDIKRHCRRVR